MDKLKVKSAPGKGTTVSILLPKAQEGFSARSHWPAGAGAADEAIWAELAENPDLPTVRYVPWGDRTAVKALTDELTHPWRPRHQRCPATGRNGRIGFGIVAGRYSQDGPPLGLCCRRWRRDLIGVDAAPRRDLGEQCLQAPPDHLGEVIGRSISAHHVLTVGRCPEIRSNWFGLCG